MNFYYIHKFLLFFLSCIFMQFSIFTSEKKGVGTHKKIMKLKTIPCKGRAEYSCNAFFTTKTSMRIHFNAIHLKLKPFKCPECSRFFAKKQNMLVHRGIHQNVQRFCCPKCFQFFSQKGNRDRHLKTHNAISRFECDWCKKKFKCKIYSKRHQVTCKKKPREEEKEEQSTLIADRKINHKEQELGVGFEQVGAYVQEDFLCSRSLLDLAMGLGSDEGESSSSLRGFYRGR